MMKKVLMIAHQFPPMGGPGVQRTSKFVKYLSLFNWAPVVFTREVKNLNLKDESLMKDIPPYVQVFRTPPHDYSEMSGIFGLMGKVLHRKVLVPDAERLWAFFSKRKLFEVIKSQSIDLIYTTSYPYSDHLLGLEAKRKFPEIPWVADFRDEWTNNPYILDHPYNIIRTKMEASMEKEVLTHADCLITNTPVMLKNFIGNYPQTENKFFVIPNGYDEEDFEGISVDAQSNQRFTFTYTGAFYRRRKPDTLFEAVRQLLDENVLSPESIEIKLIGNFKSSYMEELIKKYQLGNTVKILPYMPHKESVSHLMKSDALLLIEGGGPGAEAFYTGKVFEYMNTGRPILAIIPERGAAAGLIQETRTGYISDSEDVNTTKENIKKLYNQWKSKESSFAPDWEKIRKFERKELTSQLSMVFEKALNLKK